MQDIKSLKQEKRSTFTEGEDLWKLKRAKASYIVEALGDETLYGDNLDLTEDEVIEATDGYAVASGKEPYGDVHYCDDGMQKDKKKRFPCDTPERIRAAWSYSHHQNVMSEYTSAQLSRLHACIERAWKDKISKDGPPSAAK